MTSSGPEIRNMGAAMAGRDKDLIKAGLGSISLVLGLKVGINFLRDIPLKGKTTVFLQPEKEHKR